MKKSEKKLSQKKEDTIVKDFIPSINSISCINPIKKFNVKDILQIIVGAFVLAVPVGFTQEVWELGETLPVFNTIIVLILTLFFITIFTYYSYHSEHLHANPKYHLAELTKRVISTYILSFIIVAILMSSIRVTPLLINNMHAFNIIVLVTFPAAIGAVISDRIK